MACCGDLFPESCQTLPGEAYLFRNIVFRFFKKNARPPFLQLRLFVIGSEGPVFERDRELATDKPVRVIGIKGMAGRVPPGIVDRIE